MEMVQKISAIALLATVALPVSAQVVHTARQSKINYSYVFGAGGEVYQDSESIEDQSLVANDLEQLMFSESRSGTMSGNPWAAGVSTNQIHTFLVTGPASDVVRFEAQGQTDLSCHASGPGLAQIFNTNPGNELIQYFTVTSPQSYYLSGQITVPPSALPGAVVLQTWDGITWANRFHTWFLPGSTGPFAVNGTLPLGQHRIVATLGESGFGNVTKHCDYVYTLDFYPYTYHLATSFQVVGGLHFGGNLGSLQTSDNTHVIVLNDEFDSIGQIVFETHLPAGTTTELRTTFEGKSTRSDISQFVRMFNFTTNAFTNVNFQTCTLADSTVTGAISANVGNYVGPGGLVKSDVFWIPQTDIDSGDGWTESCDFVQWTRVP